MPRSIDNDTTVSRARPRWLLALVLCLAAACDDEEREARERHEKEQRERLLEMDARLARLEARLVRLETRPVAPPRKLSLELSADGVRLGDATIEPSRLAERLREEVASARPGEVELSVQAAPGIDHARVVEVLDLAKAAGIVRIALAASPTPAPTTP